MPSSIGEHFATVATIEAAYLSAKTGRGIRDLVARVALVADCCRYYIPTGRLNQIVREACMVHQPPVHRSGKQLKIRYVSQLKNRPATFVSRCEKLIAAPSASWTRTRSLILCLPPKQQSP
jgi:predicted GTPase